MVEGERLWLRSPSTKSTDLLFGKDLSFANTRYGVFARVSNVFDTKNCVQVYATTGNCSAGAPDQDRRQNDRRRQVILVQPAQFGKFRKVADVFERRNIIFIRNKPAHVRPKKSEERRRMLIQLLIRMPVMVPVMPRPPQHSFLPGSHRQKRDHELKHPAGFVRAVREITVIARRNEKHPHRGQRQARNEIRPAKVHEKYSNSQDVNHCERQSQNKKNAGPIGQRYR